MKRFSIVKNFFYFLAFSTVLIVWSIFLFINNLRWSVEFTWGITLTLDKQINIDKGAFKSAFKDIKPDIKIVKKDNATDIKFRSLDANVKYNNKLLSKVENYFIKEHYIKTDKDIIWTSFVWPTIWAYMKNAAKTALLWWVIIMAIYVFIAFAWVREYFAPWIFSLVTVVTLLHDVFMAAGWYGFWMLMNPLAVVDSIFVMAILTVLWYSVNDTIIIFDRIRENIMKYDEKLRKWTIKLFEIFDKSLYQVMRRSLLTSFSTLIVVACMFFFGNETLKDFSLVIFIWVLFGTYSSIFLAAPGAYRINRLITKKK